MQILVKKYEQVMKSDWNQVVDESPLGLFFFRRDYIDLCKSPQEVSVVVYSQESPIAVFPATVTDSTVSSYSKLTYGGLIFRQSMSTDLLFQIMSTIVEYYQSLDCKRLLLVKQVPYFLRKNFGEPEMCTGLFQRSSD